MPLLKSILQRANEFRKSFLRNNQGVTGEKEEVSAIFARALINPKTNEVEQYVNADGQIARGRLPIRIVTADFVVQADDHTLVLDGTGGNVAANLPPAADVPGKVYFFVRKSLANQTSIVANGSDAIDAVEGIDTEGASSGFVGLQSDGIDTWWMISGFSYTPA